MLRPHRSDWPNGRVEFLSLSLSLSFVWPEDQQAALDCTTGQTLVLHGFG